MDNEMLQAIGKMLEQQKEEIFTEVAAVEKRMHATVISEIAASEGRTAALIKAQVEPIAKQVDYIANVLEGALHLESELEDRVRKLEEAV